MLVDVDGDARQVRAYEWQIRIYFPAM